MEKNVSRLSEVFTPTVDWDVQALDESSATAVDGTNVLGRVKGQFFVPDGVSRNNRFYPESLWDKVMGEDLVKARLSEKKMFGTIGHDEEPVTEQQLRNGDVSHVVTRLWVEPGPDGSKLGMGEALILNTPAGRNLNTYLRAGCRLNTSSRASGKFLEGKEHDGIPIVDEEAYVFETFDFVLDPGFLQARPDLVEQLELKRTEEEASAMNENSQFAQEVVNTSLKTLQESRDALQTRLDEAISAKNASEAQLAAAQQRLEEYAKHDEVIPVIEKLQVTSNDAARLPRILEDLNVEDFAALVKFLEQIKKEDAEAIQTGQVAEKLAMLEAFQKDVAESPEKGVQIGEAAAKQIAAYKEFGKPEEIKEKLETLAVMERQMRPVGTPKEAQKALREAATELRAFAELGTRKEITEALERSYELLKQYRDLGSPEKIQEALTSLRRSWKA